MKRKFWNWVKNDAEEERTLILNGESSDETWYGDEVTPELFRKELNAGTEVLMSPVAMMMIHNPMTIGTQADMDRF